jgi:hypothetical protein
MQNRITITVDERFYRVLCKDLEVAYQQMAQEEAREAEALEWAEVTWKTWPMERGDSVQVHLELSLPIRAAGKEQITSPGPRPTPCCRCWPRPSVGRPG